MELRNPKSSDTDTYIDAEIKIGDEWFPHTARPDDEATTETYQRLKDEEAGPVEIVDPPRNVEGQFSAAIERGAPFKDVRLKIDDSSTRERLSSAALRFQIKGDLPGGKNTFSYPTLEGMVNINKDEVIDASVAVQDYFEAAVDRREELLADPSLDETKGWPS